MEIKSGREIFKIDRSDVIMDNGHCIQLVTRLTGNYPHRSIPVISKVNWKKYLSEMEMVKELPDQKIKYYKLKGMGK